MIMIKIVFLAILFIAFSGCHQKSTYISKFGQSIVFDPNQTQIKSGSTEIISNHKLTNSTLHKVPTKKKEIKDSKLESP